MRGERLANAADFLHADVWKAERSWQRAFRNHLPGTALRASVRRLFVLWPLPDNRFPARSFGIRSRPGKPHLFPAEQFRSPQHLQPLAIPGVVRIVEHDGPAGRHFADCGAEAAHAGAAINDDEIERAVIMLPDLPHIILEALVFEARRPGGIAPISRSFGFGLGKQIRDFLFIGRGRQSLFDSSVPRLFVFDGNERRYALGEKQGRAAGAPFKNVVFRLQPVLQIADRRKRHPWLLIADGAGAPLPRSMPLFFV